MVQRIKVMGRIERGRKDLKERRKNLEERKRIERKEETELKED